MSASSSTTRSPKRARLISCLFASTTLRRCSHVSATGFTADFEEICDVTSIGTPGFVLLCTLTAIYSSTKEHHIIITAMPCHEPPRKIISLPFQSHPCTQSSLSSLNSDVPSQSSSLSLAGELVPDQVQGIFAPSHDTDRGGESEESREREHQD